MNPIDKKRKNNEISCNIIDFNDLTTHDPKYSKSNEKHEPTEENSDSFTGFSKSISDPIPPLSPLQKIPIPKQGKMKLPKAKTTNKQPKPKANKPKAVRMWLPNDPVQRKKVLDLQNMKLVRPKLKANKPKAVRMWLPNDPVQRKKVLDSQNMKLA